LPVRQNLPGVVPALMIVLISLTWLEEDGLLLTIAMLAGVGVSVLALAAVWETGRGAEWVSRFLEAPRRPGLGPHLLRAIICPNGVHGRSSVNV
jgi:hypothetical protein